VTGGGRRVGRAICLELAGNGYDVAVHYRSNRAEAEAVVAECEQLGAAAWAVAADLAVDEQTRGLAARVLEQWPDRLDLLVNNASLFQPRPFEDITADDWERMVAVHTRAPFLLSQALLESLTAAQDGLVVHICDIGADHPLPGYAHYSVSKAGLVMLVKAMAVELAPRIRTMGISPGQVAWNDAAAAEKRERLAKRIPLARVGRPEDIASLVRYCALEGTYLNGEIIAVDGGLSKRY